MKKIVFALLFILFGAGGSLPIKAGQADNKETFEVENGKFSLNGEPFVIKAAELHYPRIPKEYWDHRIKMVKALGMNTVCLYVFWNVHEPKENQFDFTGQNDLREFVKLCQENGLKVILRPGPYVCAEWEMGGLPWWLLKKKDIRLREDDPYFLERVGEFEKKVAEQVGDLTIQNGGPIIMIQVENEYGAYGENKEYVGKIRDMLKENFGEEVMMFQCDWSSNFQLNGLDDLLWTMNFGTGADVESQFAELKRLRPDSPLMCSEYWSGWFDKWGANHETRPADEMIKGIDDMLSNDISFSLYMTHGGTNFGHWAGANSPGYSPDVTSYDYDAPINESGQPTPKYWLLRETLAKYLPEGETLPEVPEGIMPIAIEPFELGEVASLFWNLPKPMESEDIKTFEELDIGFGTVIYTTKIEALKKGDKIIVDEPHDYARVFADHKLIGTLDRRNGEKELTVKEDMPAGELTILVEAMGRINFGRAIKDYKGIIDKVEILTADGTRKELKNWKIYALPDELEFYNDMKFMCSCTEKPDEEGRYPAGVYRGTFDVEKPSDTFLNFENWGKGLVYVNGHALGRIWEIGPQQTLYTPGVWLNEGENEILIFDVVGPKSLIVEGLESPVIDKLQLPGSAEDAEIDLSQFRKVYSGKFDDSKEWQKRNFEVAENTDEIVIEIISGFDGNNRPSVAELYLTDSQGADLPRENWKVVASSQKTDGNHTADKAVDLQESTYWVADDNANAPLLIKINLGGEFEISGIRYLSGQDADSPKGMEEFNVYVSEKIKN